MKLTPTMEDALHYARDHGGRLYRFAGGFWSEPGATLNDGVPETYYGTTTIHGLIQRGAVRVVERLPRGDPLLVEIEP